MRTPSSSLYPFDSWPSSGLGCSDGTVGAGGGERVGAGGRAARLGRPRGWSDQVDGAARTGRPACRGGGWRARSAQDVVNCRHNAQTWLQRPGRFCKTSRNVDYFSAVPSRGHLAANKTAGKRHALFSYTDVVLKIVYISRSFAFWPHFPLRQPGGERLSGAAWGAGGRLESNVWQLRFATGAERALRRCLRATMFAPTSASCRSPCVFGCGGPAFVLSS